MPRALTLFAFLLSAFDLNAETQSTVVAAASPPDGLYAEFTTPRGTFTATLAYKQAPLPVTTFVGLAEGSLAARDGQPYFTGLKWYRVAPHFVIQSGDPDFDKNQEKENVPPPFTFPDHFGLGLHHDQAGVLSMANAGPDTNSTEFFITLNDCTRLNYLHSVFGRVVRGLEILPQIQPNDAVSILIVRVGPVAAAFPADEKAFQALVAKSAKYSGATGPGPTAHFDDPDKLLPTTPPRARNFNYKLANFERATGVKIVARILAHSPNAAEDEVAGATMRSHATQLGVAKSGVLAVYFADEKDWRVWIGDTLTGTFMGRPTTPADLGEGGPLHDAKEAFFAAVTQRTEANITLTRLQYGPEKPLNEADLLKCNVDAMLDALILRFEPATIP